MPSPKRVNIKDVAARAGVSYQTVSKVLNGTAQVSTATEDRIWKAASELRYKPHLNARNLRTQRSWMIGYSWVPTKPGQANHILDTFLSSMVEEAEAAGYHLLPFPYREGQEQVTGYEELINSGRVDGFVLSSINYHDVRLRFLLDQKFPFVVFGRPDSEGACAYVDVDGMQGIYAATQHLIEQGHTRIALLAWPENSRVGNERVQGYLKALGDAGLTVDPNLIARGEGTFEFGYAATGEWLQREVKLRPTAIVAVSDTLAIGALHAGQVRGCDIGRELAITGFDDAPMAQYLWPPLTSVRQPIREAGQKCVELLVNLLEGRGLQHDHCLLVPELIKRSSSLAN